MKISIIVPVYNVEEHIERCFDSIAKQTYTKIECIFVDDCTPDLSGKILKNKISNYDGNIEFKIIRHPHNKGLSEARNTGTYAANGKYIYYIDSDDEITPDCIENFVNVAKKYKNVDIVQGNTHTIPQPEPENDWRNILLKKFPEFSDDRQWIKKHFFEKPVVPVNAWNKLIRKAFLYDNNLFFKKGIIHEDELWMFFVSKKIRSIAFSKQVTYIHYIMGGSIMQSKSNYNSIKSQLIIAKEMFKNFDSVLEGYQRKKALYLIHYNLIRLDINKNEKIFLEEYRKLIFSELSISLKKMRLFSATLLLFFLLPQQIIKSFPVKKLTGLLMMFVVMERVYIGNSVFYKSDTD